MKKNLNGIKRVRFCDYTSYEAEKSSNGGCYGFWKDYNRLDDGNWEVSYGTTADFEYCPVCGSFNEHYEGDDCCYDSGYSCGDFETVTEEELLKLRIENAFLKELRRLRLEDETKMRERQESSAASEDSSN